MWPNKSLDYVKLPEDNIGHHFGVFIDDSLVAVGSLFLTNHEAQFRKLATEIAYQGKGYGSLLTKHLMDYAQKQGAKRVWCNARLDKTGFYERLGLRITDQTFHKGGIDYVIMQYIVTD
ncbi:MAG: GNAT family N-acetyltransferase [Bacteroidota bacterium]